ncbi:molybdopterin converting factor subunit 1 [Paraglaciecola agarilytica]|uniref:molybdopterin converting factor subunit 1 n=1 Tax=Paraglaciecola chathamensis TaxID=368405 RepID=UPI001C08EE62|nr:molybdopterin converting factor subunit 1 [Paraglaciecola agarilytica]MBU3019634.1 molybdopterin converting factor subunit 1 [Paraglaciecola agarilytica]
MIQVLFFGQLKDQVKMPSVKVEESATSVGELKKVLGVMHPQWQQYLSKDSILVAVNQTIGNDQTVLNDGDEVAFFPPVTGG